METARTHNDLRRLGGSVLTSSLALLILPHALGGTAAAAGPTHSASRYSVVAQSDIDTAATGRRPISTRIAMARQPISIVPAAPEQPAPPTQAEPTERDTREVEPLVVAEPEQRVEAHGYQTLEALASQPAHQVPPVAARPSEPATLPSEPAALSPVVEAQEKSGPLSIGRFSYPASVGGELPVPGKPGLLPPATSTVTLRVSEPETKTAQGEAIELRLQLCNAGSEPAHNVSAMLFFAEGIEPVAASGGEASLATGEVRFDTLATLGPGEIVELLVTGIGTEAGAIQYRAEVVSGDQPEPIAKDGVVQVTPGR